MFYRLGEFDLALGPYGPGFDALGEEQQQDRIIAALERMWQRRRETFMADWIDAYPATRPWSWWTFHADADRPARDDELDVLAAMGELSDDERDDVAHAASGVRRGGR